jgi:LmbE family N-acetylglucosaminyl deacetylase
MSQEYVLCIVAHSDDQVMGPGGAMIKYAKEGKKVITIVFSYGEKSHPHFKKEIIQDIRVKESEKADKLMGGEGVYFLGLTEGKFEEEFEKKMLQDYLTKYKPSRIFTHAQDDSHPDHKAVHKLVLQTYDDMKLKSSVYTFGVWRVLRFASRNSPALVVDISEEFRKKIASLDAFKSQWIAKLALTWSLYVKAIISGFKYGYEFAEVFYKVR